MCTLPEYIDALKDSVVVFKLLSAISSLVRKANPSSYYLNYVQQYEGIISAYETVIAVRTETSRKTDVARMPEGVN